MLELIVRLLQAGAGGGGGGGAQVGRAKGCVKKVDTIRDVQQIKKGNSHEIGLANGDSEPIGDASFL